MLRPKSTTIFEAHSNLIKVQDAELFKDILGNDYMVRITTIQSLEKQYKNRLGRQYTGEELLNLGTTLYNELRDQYGIDSPFSIRTIRIDNNDTLIATIVDLIEGTDLQHSSQEEIKSHSVEIKTLYEKIAKYYLSKLHNREPFLTDICGPSQYIYGLKKNINPSESSVDKFFLIDTDFYLDDRSESLALTVYWFCRHLSWLEYRIEGKVDAVRAVIADLCNLYEQSIPSISDKHGKCLSEVRRFLEDLPFGDQILPAIPTFDGA
ncbi:MAG: hypothetical protein ACOYT9_04800 [Patescibacteria group bacterium]|jgi:hypothetical protein